MKENVFTEKKITIDHLSYTDVMNIWFWGDVHRDTSSCDVDRWRWFLQKAMRDDPEKTYYMGMGDYHDFASRSERKKIMNAMLHETTEESIEELMQKRNRAFCIEIAQMKGRLLGLVEGNHTWQFANGRTSTEDLCDRMGCEYLGTMTHLSLAFRFGNKTQYVDIVAHHGKAGGKTAGITINQVDDLRKVFPAADIYCVSDDTEILTFGGWKKRGEVSDNDAVYCYDFDKGKMVPSRILNKVEFDYVGDMVKIENQNTSQLLHPEHRVYYKHRNGEYIVKTAKHISNIHSQIRLPVSGDLSGGSSGDYLITDDEVELTGWIISEGHFKGGENDSGSGILIYQKNKEKTGIIKRCLDRCGYEYNHKLRDDGMNVFYIKSQSAKEIRIFVDQKKRLPVWVRHLNNHQFDIFWKAFALGDGNIQKTGNSGTMYSAEYDLIEDLQIAGLLHGYRSKIKHRKTGFSNGCYELVWSKNNTTELNTKRRITKEKYSGIVWCVQTEYGNFIARRKGMPFITGNCMGHDHERGAWPKDVLIRKDGGLKQHRQFLCRSGSFKKAYAPGRASYEIGRIYRPSDLGALKLMIGFHRDRKDGRDRIITDIEALI
mgnify:CR=1 FL=1